MMRQSIAWFRLVRRRGRMNLWEYTLEVKGLR